MKCPRCGQTHLIEEFVLTLENSHRMVTFAAGNRPVLSGFLCDGWFYRVEAFRLDYEHVQKDVPR